MCKKIQMLILILILMIGNFNTTILAQDLTKDINGSPNSKKAVVVDTSFDRLESPKTVDVIYRKMNDSIQGFGNVLYLDDKTWIELAVHNAFVIESQNPIYKPLPDSERSRWKRNGLFILLIAVAGAAVGAVMAATKDNDSNTNFIQPTLPRSPILKN